MLPSRKHKIRNLEDFAGIASDWFWETDADHRFTYFSSRMKEVTKLEPSTILGKRRDAIPKEKADDPMWIEHLADLRAHRPFHNFEYSLVRPTDGNILWVRISGQPQFDRNGVFTGYRGAGHNITREKEAMARLEAFNQELATRNAELDEAKTAIERIANEDALTGLANRRSFERDVQSIGADSGGQVALLHIDLDRFKWINDTMGHPAGDAVLVETAKRISSIAGQHGKAYRVGGDEFLVVLTDQKDDHLAMWIGDSIIDAMQRPVRFGQQRPVVGASVGVAIKNMESCTPTQLVAYADVALYEAKRSGRNTVCQLTPQIQATIDDRRQLTNEIARALEERQFIPFFQPQYDAVDDCIVGIETLVRWQHPSRGILAPNAFLDVAAEMGVVAKIDKLMLEQSLATIKRLADHSLLIPSVSVNISEARLLDAGLADDVQELWTDRRCKLSIELLETIYFDDYQDTHQFATNLKRLRDMGVGIETDDFGSGRASITGLFRISPDRLKIDRSLVKDVIKDPTKRSVVSAILEMSRALGIESIAEGVETQDDIDAMRALGCRTFQGYAIAKPLAEDALRPFLAQMRIAQKQQTKMAGQGGLPKTA